MLHIALDIIYTLTTRERDITWRLQDRGVLMDAVGFFSGEKRKKLMIKKWKIVKSCLRFNGTACYSFSVKWSDFIFTCYDMGLWWRRFQRILRPQVKRLIHREKLDGLMSLPMCIFRLPLNNGWSHFTSWWKVLHFVSVKATAAHHISKMHFFIEDDNKPQSAIEISASQVNDLINQFLPQLTACLLSLKKTFPVKSSGLKALA